MFCCFHSSIAIILMGKRELVAMFNLSTRTGDQVNKSSLWDFYSFIQRESKACALTSLNTAVQIANLIM